MPKNFNAHAVIFSLAGVLALATASECHSITHLPSLLYGVVLWGWWALLASAMWKLGQKNKCVGNISPRARSLLPGAETVFTSRSYPQDDLLARSAIWIEEPRITAHGLRRRFGAAESGNRL